MGQEGERGLAGQMEKQVGQIEKVWQMVEAGQTGKVLGGACWVSTLTIECNAGAAQHVWR